MAQEEEEDGEAERLRIAAPDAAAALPLLLAEAGALPEPASPRSGAGGGNYRRGGREWPEGEEPELLEDPEGVVAARGGELYWAGRCVGAPGVASSCTLMALRALPPLLLAAVGVASVSVAGTEGLLRWWDVPRGPQRKWGEEAQRFRTVLDGTCEDFGLSPILDWATCQVAGAQLGLVDTGVQLTPDLDRPEGCYMLKSWSGMTLWLATNGRNRGNGASKALGLARIPVCLAPPGAPVPEAPPPAELPAGPPSAAPPWAAEALPAAPEGDSSAPADDDGEGADAEAFGEPPSPWGTAPIHGGVVDDSFSSPLGVVGRSTTTTRTVRTTSTTTTSYDYAAPLAFRPPTGRPLALACLEFRKTGCYTVDDRDMCLGSRDGRAVVSMDGRLIHGQPCVWCGGGSCLEGAPSRCEPYDWVVKSARFDLDRARSEGFQVASCPDLEGQRPPTLYCFALMMPDSYERILLQAQLAKGAGVFACHESAVFSNQSLRLRGAPGQTVVTQQVPGPLSVSYGGKWGTALNTAVFVRVWRSVVEHGRYKRYDWTVKADPDTVFFPDRLRELLLRRPLSLDKEALAGTFDAGAHPECGKCRIPELTNVTCVQHVRQMQDRGRSCASALAAASGPPPNSCGCDCPTSACDPVASGMYLNNCPFGMHGPLEVVSRRAVETYAAGLAECREIAEQPFGEDMYLRRCLRLLGVREVDEFDLLRESACGENPQPCTTANVAFHPFKDMDSYFDCWARATNEGEWP